VDRERLAAVSFFESVGLSVELAVEALAVSEGLVATVGGSVDSAARALVSALNASELPSLDDLVVGRVS